MNVLIVAGGTGTRLWPASRRSQPKQLLKLLGDKTLLQNTYQRFAGFAKPGQIFVATTAAYAPLIKRQLARVPSENFSLEPTLRDRGPAIGLAALIMEHRSPGQTFVTAWSDHHINPKQKYLSTLRRAERYLKQQPQTTLQIGVTPTFPHTGMGYIKQGRKIANRQGLALYQADSFKEKPDLATARRFISSKRYLWNTGIFMWNTRTLLGLYQRHLPEIYRLLMKIKPALGTGRQQAIINRWYPRMPHADIESHLLEKLTANLAVIAADFNWADVGSWKIIKDIQSKSRDNVSRGLHFDQNSRGSLVYNYNTKQFVATLGLDNVVIIVTPEAILVANKNNSEELKGLVRTLQKNPRFKRFL